LNRRVSWGVLLLTAVTAWPAVAQDVSGTLFDDRDGDGIHDSGEPVLEGVDVRLFGTAVPDVGVDQTVVTGVDGSYLFSPDDGCYLVTPVDPPGWRMSVTRSDRFPEGFPGYLYPIGQPRFAKLDRAVDNLQSGVFRQSALGDSIAANFNLFCGGIDFWYNQQLQSRLGCVSGATISLDQAAALGETTDDLLVDEPDLNNVFRMIDVQPDLITLSMIGNDLLDVDPGDGGNQQDTNRAVAEVLDARQNLQEALSAFVSEIPDADVVLNSLYDNEAEDCNPTGFHAAWLPIVDRILRDLAWGQTRRISINEVAAEFAQLDQGGQCTGFQGMICMFFLDLIHPTQVGGYPIIAEKLWEAAGGVTLGTDDALGRSSFGGVDYGYLRHVRRLLPTAWEVRDGAVVTNPAAALSDQDGGAPSVITLGNGTEEFRLFGFPSWYDEIQIVRVVAGVRYRTRGTVVDDLYRMEASVTGQFRPPPGFAYTPTDWNFYTPIVGGGGPSQPPENPDYLTAQTLVVPDVLSYREVSATLTKNPTLPPGASDYEWPAVTHDELATTAIRVAAAPDPGAAGDDAYRVELDYAWLDLYGWEKDRPAEVENLLVNLLGDGTLDVSFDAVTDAQRYNLYAGRLSSLSGGVYDHGAAAPAGPFCDAPTQAAGTGRLAVQVPPGDQPPDNVYLLVTAHVDDVESPAGHASGPVEIDRSQSVCK
jgi:hypothetical protein